MTESSEIVQGRKGQIDLILKDPAIMAEVLTGRQRSTSSNNSYMAQISIKLDNTNQVPWFKVVEMYISNKDKLRYINIELPLPSPTDPTFQQWQIEDSIMKERLINNMDISLINNFIYFPTVKATSNSIATTLLYMKRVYTPFWMEYITIGQDLQLSRPIF